MKFEVRIMPEILTKPDGEWCYEIWRNGERHFRAGPYDSATDAIYHAGCATGRFLMEAMRVEPFQIQVLQWREGKFQELSR